MNAQTPKDMCSVKYPDFAEAIRRCLEEGRFCFIAKSDMKSAFRKLGIKPEQFCYLVMVAQSPLDNKWYFFIDKCLAFGVSINCLHFQCFSNSIAHILQHRTKRHPVNYMDDFFFIAILRSCCNGQVKAFLQICDQIRFPVSLEKTYWASNLLTFLGLLIDTINEFVSIPVDKVQRAIDLIQEILNHRKKKAMVRQLQRLSGFLNFLCRCIV